jgi:nucleoside-diphosphate-sugar epimerase
MTDGSIGPGDVVLVTGATGFTGVHLVRALCAAGAEVRAIVRESSNLDVLEGLPVTLHRGEVYDEATCREAARGVHYVFHVAAAFREARIEDIVYRRVHVESTQHLARALAGQEGFRRFVHVSTMGVHGHIEHPPADEEYPFAPGDEYQRTKVEAETWVRDFARESGLPLTVVRPCAIYGPGDRRLLKLFRMAKRPVVPVLGVGSKNLYHLVHVSDLVAFMMHVAVREDTLGQVYLCGADEPIRLVDMIGRIAARLGTGPRIVRLPVTPFFWAGDLCEAVCKPLGVEPPIYRRRVAFFTKDRAFDTSKMRSTGFANRYSNETGIDDLADWYRREGWL